MGGVFYIKSGLIFSNWAPLALFLEKKAILKPRFLEEKPLLGQEMYNDMQIFLMGDLVGTHN